MQLQDTILSDLKTDIIALQEICGDTQHQVEEDFDFMLEKCPDMSMQYKYVRHQKTWGHMTSGTFWKDEKFELLVASHKHRTLLTILRQRQTGRVISIINVHLSAGPNPDQRLRQIHEALDQTKKELTKLSSSNRRSFDPAMAPVILCGDFNSCDVTAARSGTSDEIQMYAATAAAVVD